MSHFATKNRVVSHDKIPIVNVFDHLSTSSSNVIINIPQDEPLKL